jgi:hypothetical protein
VFVVIFVVETVFVAFVVKDRRFSYQIYRIASSPCCRGCALGICPKVVAVALPVWLVPNERSDPPHRFLLIVKASVVPRCDDRIHWEPGSELAEHGTHRAGVFIESGSGMITYGL